jgi:hypothetical protein
MSYRQIFDEAIGQTPPSGVDIDRVVRRQRRAARVRPALATLAAAAVLAAGGGVALQLTGGSATQAPGDPLAGFPEYVDGARVIAAAEGSIDEQLSLTFTPGTVDLVLLTRCESDQVGEEPVVLEADLTSNVGPATTTLDWLCVVGEPGAVAPDSVLLQDGDGWGGFWDGLAVGEPTTLDVEVVGAREMAGDWLPDLPDGTLAVGIAERVTWEEYEFPQRPGVLAPLPEARGGSVEVRADTADPNRRMETTMVWRDEYGCGAEVAHPFSLISQTPGSLTVFVDGVEVGERVWWDYEQAEFGFVSDALCGEVTDGEVVTVAVEPEHMTGDWRVRIQRGG